MLKQAWHTRTGLMMRRRRILSNIDCIYKINTTTISWLSSMSSNDKKWQEFISELFLNLLKCTDEHCSNVIQVLTLNKTLSTITTVMLRRMKIEWHRNGTFQNHHLLSSDPRPLDLVDLSRPSCTLDLCPLRQTLGDDICRKSIHQY